jgi:hypothetical protein
MFGIGFLVLAIIPILQMVGIPRATGYGTGLLLAGLLWLTRRNVTLPRLGSVEFGPKRRTRRMLFGLIALGMLFLTLPLLIVATEGYFASGLSEDLALPVASATLVAALILIAAYMLDYPRMYVYALILVAGIPHAEFIVAYTGKPLNSLISFGLPAVAVLTYGFILLSRFLKTYPNISAETNHAGQ